MRAYAPLPQVNNDAIPQVSDSVQTMLLASSAAQAIGWPADTTGGTTAARTVGAMMVRFTAVSTAAVPTAALAMVNLVSTFALNPTSGSSVTTTTTAGSTGNNVPVFGTRTLQVPAHSTGWSAIALGGAYLMAEVWRL